MAKAALRIIGRKVTPSTRFHVRLPGKTVSPELLTADHRAWRQAVLKRAGYRCEVIENGMRCNRRAPASKLIADHVKERRDGGALLDLRNGMCVCMPHHIAKTRQVRAQRYGVLTQIGEVPPVIR